MIFNTIQDIIARQIGIEKAKIQPESNLMQDLDADSIEAVEIIMAIEDEYGVEIPDDAVEHIITVQDLVDFIESNVQ